MVLHYNNIIKPRASLQYIIRFRVEQEVSIMLNGIPVNNAQVKTDYTVTHNENEPLLYSIHVDDSIAKISPDSHQPLLDTVKEIDRIKTNTDILINPFTGKPEKLKNHEDIISEWQDYKHEFLKKREFIRAEEVKQNVINFVTAFDEQIHSHDQLISSLDAQIFFTTFFDYFLVNENNFESNVMVNFHSQIFEKVTTPLSVTQMILQESPDNVVIRRKGSSENNFNTEEIKKQYNEKYKPALDYQFSTYAVEYDSQIGFNTINKHIEYADIRMREYVKNNVELDISCRIRRIS